MKKQYNHFKYTDDFRVNDFVEVPLDVIDDLHINSTVKKNYLLYNRPDGEEGYVCKVSYISSYGDCVLLESSKGLEPIYIPVTEYPYIKHMRIKKLYSLCRT